MAGNLGDPVNIDFVKQLPKVELHAHLSGSVNKQTLHRIWQRKHSLGRCDTLEDPISALSSIPNVSTFFAIFNEYIYKLLDDIESVQEATIAVVDDFERDGVVYLELRTTPRALSSCNVDRRSYVRAVLQALEDRQRSSLHANQAIETHLLLSVDRSMSLEEAEDVLQLACEHAPGSSYHREQQLKQGLIPTDELLKGRSTAVPLVLGIDLCGNPMKGDVRRFTSIFQKAKEDHGLHTTVHFAEVRESSTDIELETVLSWKPDRLGHVIHIRNEIRDRIKKDGTALELCLSCNMLAGMIKGEYRDHHLGVWLASLSTNAIALSTDDVGVFGSPLSNEYALAAKHFNLDRSMLIELSRSASCAAFSGQERTAKLLSDFESLSRRE